MIGGGAGKRSRDDDSSGSCANCREVFRQLGVQGHASDVACPHCTASCCERCIDAHVGAAAVPACLDDCVICGARHRRADAHSHRLIGQDQHGNQCCASNGAACRACGKVVRNAAMAAHYLGTDAQGHHSCVDNAQVCGTCNSVVCNAACQASHYSDLACGHLQVCHTLTCKGCRRCNACQGALTVGLCAPCRTTASAAVQGFTVTFQALPSGGAVRRQTRVAGPVSPAGSAGRATPPPPLASGMVLKAANTGDLKLFDRGHLVALELSGKDASELIVPQNKQLNQSGKWRQMELAVGAFLPVQNRVAFRSAVDDSAIAIPVAPVVHAAVPLNGGSAGAVLNPGFQIEIDLFYDDVHGDHRVPVWFYVRLTRGGITYGHFSIANRCSKAATMPTLEEAIEFEAAQAIYDGLTDDRRNVLIAPDALPLYFPTGGALARPNQLLEFMLDVNFRAAQSFSPRVFSCMHESTVSNSLPYDDFQRAILRKFNRWRNRANGWQLRSDAAVANPALYPGEEGDLFAQLDECDGRSAPEVDHIDPSFRSGANSYLNARLVSFHHNHLYREKQLTGSVALDLMLFDLFQHSQVLCLFNGLGYYVSQGTVLGSEWGTPAVLYTFAMRVQPTLLSVAAFFTQHFADHVLFEVPGRNLLISQANAPYNVVKNARIVNARQTYLQAEERRAQRYAEEQNLAATYNATTARHRAGVDAMIRDRQHQWRQDLQALIATQVLPLCEPSDLLADGIDGFGRISNPTMAQAAPQYGALDGDPAYLAVIGRWNALWT